MIEQYAEAHKPHQLQIKARKFAAQLPLSPNAALPASIARKQRDTESGKPTGIPKTARLGLYHCLSRETFREISAQAPERFGDFKPWRKSVVFERPNGGAGSPEIRGIWPPFPVFQGITGKFV
jgi:hypothetical protein